MKGFVIAVLFLGVIGTGVYVAGTNYFVNTEDGIKRYSKSQFTLTEIYVDMNTMSFLELWNHVDLVSVMAREGDLEYVPGGKTLEAFGRAGQSVIDAVERFDSEFQITDSLREIERIGQEKYEALDETYDIEGKAEKTNEFLKRQ